jgi:hypothetical protein
MYVCVDVNIYIYKHTYLCVQFLSLNDRVVEILIDLFSPSFLFSYQFPSDR